MGPPRSRRAARWVVVVLVVLFASPGYVISTGAPRSVTTEILRGLPSIGVGSPSATLTSSPMAAGPGYVKWTLCLESNALLNGSGGACPNATHMHPYGATFDSANGEVYVANFASNNLSVVSGSTSTVVSSIPLGLGADAATFDPANGYIYISRGGGVSGNLSVVSGSTNTVVATIPVGSYPYGAAYDSANGDIYVVNLQSNTVSVVDGPTNTVVATIPVGAAPSGPAYDSANGDVYFSIVNTTTYQDYESAMSGSTNKVVANVSVGSDSQQAAFDPVNGDVYVANSGSNSVSVVAGSTNTVIATIPVGLSPFGVIYDSADGDIYVTNAQSNNVSVIAGVSNTITDTIPVGAFPDGGAVDPTNGYVYVTNQLSDSVSIITPGKSPPMFPVSFTETGLPAGTSWSVTLNGVTNASTGAGIGFTEPNGTYPFTVGAVPGYTSNITSGTVIVLGGPISQSITLTPTVVGPTISAVTASPSTVVLGQTTTLSVSASGGTGTLTYAYTGLPPGCSSADTPSLSCAPNGVGSFSVRVYVNDSAGQSANATTPLTVTPSAPPLSGVLVFPPSSSLQEGLSSNFTATISCTGGPCPSGAYYSWSLTNGLAILNSSTGNPTQVTARSTVGAVTLFVNATLNGRTKGASASIAINASSRPVLASASVSPSTVSVTAGGTRTFTVSPSCTGGTCPSGTSYAWGLNDSLGSLNSSTGSMVVFRAGNTPGTIQLNVSATLGGKTVAGFASLTIVALSNSPAPPSLLGLPRDYGYLLLIGLVAVVAAVAVIFVVRRQRATTVPPP